MFSECVLNDPGNLEYVEAMLSNLQRKYKNNKRGARLKGFGGRGVFKKAVASEDWEEVLRMGMDLLKTNPWDVTALRGLANACKANHYNEVELRYLKNALDVNSKDIEVNKHCAESLARMGQFDQAIVCWHRIEELDKGNVEAKKKMSELTLAKQLGGTLPEAASSSTAKQPGKPADTPAKSAPVPAKSSKTVEDSTPSVETLEQALAKDAGNLDHYVQLAQIHTENQRFREAYQTLKKALEASGGRNLQIQQRMEEAQIRMIRSQVVIAEQRAESEKTTEANDLVRRFRAELNRQELLIYNGRCERFPDDLALRSELGVRLRRDGNFREAIKAFEMARNDANLRAAATLEMGECFQHLKRYGNAMKCYQSSSTDQTAKPEVRKLALYRAAVLATALKNLEAATGYLEKVIELDPDYRDARPRLDKLKQISDSG
ncbi:MAG: hypothetical protein P8N76_00565 [Pirellulaceae bacterium]|nr:hypothetical protein [Pirellulaceae bacterium]